MLFLGAPALAAGACWFFDLRVGGSGDVLAAVAILTGLIFNVFVLIFDLTMRAADRTDLAYRERVIRLADELRANVSYAVLVGISLTALLGGLVMFGEDGARLSFVPTMLVVFAGSQLLWTIAMILKRVRALYRTFRVTQPEVIP